MPVEIRKVVLKRDDGDGNSDTNIFLVLPPVALALIAVVLVLNVVLMFNVAGLLIEIKKSLP